MPRGRLLQPLDLGASARVELESRARSRTLPVGLVRRAEIVLRCADGLDNGTVADELGTSRQTVGKWRERFRSRGLRGLYDERRPGKPRTIEDDDIMALLRKTLDTKPADGSTQWSCRSMVEATGLSKSTVQRAWSAFGIQPHRQKNFKLSTAPFFVEKVHDIVGLYLNPPDHAMVLCVERRVRRKLSSAPSPCFPLGSDTSKASRTTISDMGQLRSSPPWTSPPVRCSANASRGIAIRNSSASSSISTPTCLLISPSISSSIPQTHQSHTGSLHGPATTSTSHPPIRLGSIRWRSGSTSSRRKPSAADRSSPSLTSSPGFSSLPTTTIPPPARLPGPLPLTRFSRRSSAYVMLFPGQDASAAPHKLWYIGRECSMMVAWRPTTASASRHGTPPPGTSASGVIRVAGSRHRSRERWRS